MGGGVSNERMNNRAQKKGFRGFSDFHDWRN